jgi:acyl dehydratase
MNVQPGDQIPSWHMPSVLASRMQTMAAILRDPNPVHWDRRVVAKLGYGERTINQGPLGLSYMVNMLQAWAGHTCIRRIYMTFPRVVLDGDDITAMGTVTAVREVGGERLADCDIWLERVGGDRPLVGRATVVLPT